MLKLATCQASLA